MACLRFPYCLLSRGPSPPQDHRSMSTMSNNVSNGIEGKVVVITGASSELGEAAARNLSAKGASLVLGARRLDRLENIAADLRKAGGMIDINIKGVLYGIAAALPVFQQQNSGHFINISSVAGIKVFSPGGTVYSGTKFAVRAISEGLRHEVGAAIRTTIILPGAVDSELKFGSSHEESAKVVGQFYQQAIPADSVARAIAYAIEQPADVDINEIVLRPTMQEF